MTPAGHVVGCDLTEVADVAESIATFGDAYLRRVYTALEIEQTGAAAERLAARFAAKEAVVKLLAEPDIGTDPHDVEVVLTDGVPTLRLHGTVCERAAARWDRIELSLSHTATTAMAVVIAREVP